MVELNEEALEKAFRYFQVCWPTSPYYNERAYVWARREDPGIEEAFRRALERYVENVSSG